MRRALVLACLIYVAAELINAVVAYRSLTLPGLTPSVTTFAYDAMRTGHVVSHVNTNLPLRVENESQRYAVVSEGASKITPLYLNGVSEEGGFGAGRRIVVFATETSLRAVDVDSAALLWEVAGFQGRISATPVIDRARGWIYFYTSEQVPTKSERGRVLHHVYQVRTDGSGLDGFEVGLDQLARAHHPEPLHDVWASRSLCKTAMGLNTRVSPPYVFFGCSIRTHEPYNKYGEPRGLSGQVAAFELDDGGRLAGFEHNKVFYSSVPVGDSVTGYDSGIYSAGSGPAVLPDGSLLVATGNGPVFLDQDNFGCSVVRLRGETLRPARRADGRVLAFSHSVPPYNECWRANVDYASSAVAVVEHEGSLLASVTTKDGNLDWFDPDEMEPGRSKVGRATLGRSATYGQPVIVANDAGVRIYGALNDRPGGESRGDVLLARRDMLDRMENVVEVACYGFVAAEGSAGSAPLVLLYSGPSSDEHMVAVRGSDLYHSLTSFFDARLGARNNDRFQEELRAPYVQLADLGYSVPRGDHGDLSRLLLREFADWPIRKRLRGRRFAREEFWFVESSGSADQCETPREDGLVPLYRVTRRSAGRAGGKDRVVAFDVDGDDLRERWSYRLEGEEELLRSHPAVSTNEAGGSPVLLTAIQREEDWNSPASRLLLLDGDSGRPIARADFHGPSHFSMPLVFDEKIVVATAGSGLAVFSVSPRIGARWLWNGSLLHRLFAR